MHMHEHEETDHITDDWKEKATISRDVDDIDKITPMTRNYLGLETGKNNKDSPEAYEKYLGDPDLKRM